MSDDPKSNALAIVEGIRDVFKEAHEIRPGFGYLGTWATLDKIARLIEADAPAGKVVPAFRRGLLRRTYETRLAERLEDGTILPPHMRRMPRQKKIRKTFRPGVASSREPE